MEIALLRPILESNSVNLDTLETIEPGIKIKNLDAKQNLLNQNPLPTTAKAKEQDKTMQI